MRTVLITLALLLVSCAGSLEQGRSTRLAARDLGVEQYPRDDARCRALDDRRATWGAVAVGGAVVTGTSGVSTLPVEELPDRYRGTARYAAAGTALVAATVTAAALHLEAASDEAWARECAGP